MLQCNHCIGVAHLQSAKEKNSVILFMMAPSAVFGKRLRCEVSFRDTVPGREPRFETRTSRDRTSQSQACLNQNMKKKLHGVSLALNTLSERFRYRKYCACLRHTAVYFRRLLILASESLVTRLVAVVLSRYSHVRRGPSNVRKKANATSHGGSVKSNACPNENFPVT